LELEKATTGAESPKEAKVALERARKLKTELEEKRDALREKIPTREFFSRKYIKESLETRTLLTKEWIKIISRDAWPG